MMKSYAMPLTTRLRAWRSCHEGSRFFGVVRLRGFFGMAKVIRLYSRRQVTMAISRVWIEDGCLSCGVAESICPAVFLECHGNGNTVIEGVDLSKFEAKIKEAADSCPAEVIKYQ